MWKQHAKSSMDLLQWPGGLDNITLQELKEMLTPQKSNVTGAGAKLPKLGGDLADILAGTVGSPALSQTSRRDSLDDLDHTLKSVGRAVATQDSDAGHLQGSAFSSPVDKGVAPSQSPSALTVGSVYRHASCHAKLRSILCRVSPRKMRTDREYRMHATTMTTFIQQCSRQRCPKFTWWLQTLAGTIQHLSVGGTQNSRCVYGKDPRCVCRVAVPTMSQGSRPTIYDIDGHTH